MKIIKALTSLALVIPIAVFGQWLGLDRDPGFVANLTVAGAAGGSCSTLQNNHTTSPVGDYDVGHNASFMFVSQHFWASNDYDTCKVQLELSPSGSPVQTLTVNIWYTTNSAGDGGPIGVIGTSSTVDASTLSGTAYVDFTFPTPVTLVNGSNYFLSIRCNQGEIDAANFVQWHRNNDSLGNSIWTANTSTNWTLTAENRTVNYKFYSE